MFSESTNQVKSLKANRNNIIRQISFNFIWVFLFVEFKKNIIYLPLQRDPTHVDFDPGAHACHCSVHPQCLPSDDPSTLRYGCILYLTVHVFICCRFCVLRFLGNSYKKQAIEAMQIVIIYPCHLQNLGA